MGPSFNNGDRHTMTSVTHKPVVLVAGASGDLGRAITREFARTGASLLLVAHDEGALKRTADALRSTNAEVATHHADLTRLDAAQGCVGAAIAHFGQLDVLVNCAGATQRGDFFTLTDEDWANGFALKFHGCVRLCRAAWPHLAARQGAVINIVGVSSRTPSADFTIGGSVNSALLSFTKALADLGVSAGVRVNAINPGYIATDRLARRIEAMVNARGISYEAAEAELLHTLGIRRFGQPEEIGQLAAFLASAQASYIHGATIDIDGGATRGL